MSHSARNAFITELAARSDDDDDDDNEDVEQGKGRRDSSGQMEYVRACKKCGVVPLSVFRKQLNGFNMSLKFQKLNSRAAKACTMGLMFNWTISSLDLQGCEIGPVGTKYLCDVLQRKPSISELNLSSNKLGSDGLKRLTELLQSNHSIINLDIAHNDFNENDAIYIKEILEGDNSVTELRLSHNKFCEEGGRVIASGLVNNDFLKILDLSWNHLRGTGASALGFSLMKNTHLEVLNVAWNGFEIPGCHGLGHGLENNKTLVELNVGTNRIGLTALCKLLEGLKYNSTLEILNLSDNPLTSRGTLLVLQVLEKCSAVKNVDFGMHPVEEEVLDKLKDIQEIKPLTVLHGKVHLKMKDSDGDPTMYISGDPIVILFEFARIKEIPILDLFMTFDTDNSHSISWDEFREGITVSRIPLRAGDIDHVIRNIDINMDGEINFTELVIAQKSHNMKVKKLLDRGPRAFAASAIGKIHLELHKWFHDKEVKVEAYSLYNDERIGGLDPQSMMKS